MVTSSKSESVLQWIFRPLCDWPGFRPPFQSRVSRDSPAPICYVLLHSALMVHCHIHTWSLGRNLSSFDFSGALLQKARPCFCHAAKFVELFLQVISIFQFSWLQLITPQWLGASARAQRLSHFLKFFSSCCYAVTDATRMSDLSFLNVEFLVQLFHLLLNSHYDMFFRFFLYFSANRVVSVFLRLLLFLPSYLLFQPVIYPVQHFRYFTYVSNKTDDR